MNAAKILGMGRDHLSGPVTLYLDGMERAEVDSGWIEFNHAVVGGYYVLESGKAHYEPGPEFEAGYTQVP